MKKKILIVSNKLECGGVEKSLISLLQSLDYNMVKVDLLLTSKYGFFDKYIPNEVNLVNPPKYFEWILIPKKSIISAIISSIGKNLNFFKLIYYLVKGIFINNMGIARQQLWKSCQKDLEDINETYDVAIDYSGWFKPFIIDKVDAYKKLTWIHSDYKVYKRDKNIDNEDYKNIDSIITISEKCSELFVNEFPEYKNKCYVIPNISNKLQITNMSNEEINFDNDYIGIKILDVTRLDPNKGINIAIKACRKLLDEGYDIRWYIIGDGSERKKLEALIQENNLGNRFIMLGLKSNPYPYIKNADMIVHCSLFEGKSVAIDEAMLLARPIILTNYTTARDQIKDGINGMICDISVEGVVNAIKLMIDDKDMRTRFTENLKNFDIPTKESIDEFYRIMDL